MTEAMPFLQKAILLSYDPRPFRQGAFSALAAGLSAGCARSVRLRQTKRRKLSHPGRRILLKLALQSRRHLW